MMNTSMPFDHRPDPVIGAALRQALSAEDHSTFVARVTAALTGSQTVYWDVLASWARTGIAAACVVAVGAGLVLGTMQPAPVDLVGSIAGPSAQEMVATVGPPDPGVALLSADLR